MAGTYQAMKAYLGAVPPEGPMAVPWPVDFTVNQNYVMDLTLIQAQARISMIQTIYVDNSASSAPLNILVQTINQMITVPPKSQAYIPLVASNKLAVNLQSASGLVIPVMLLNIAINPAVWSVAGSANVVSGSMQVSDPILDATVVNQKVRTVGGALSGDGATYMTQVYGTRMVSVELTAATSTALFTAAAGFGWVLTSLTAWFSPDAIIAAAGRNYVTLLEGATVIAQSAKVALPAAAPTFAAAAAPLRVFDLQNCNLTSKVTASALNVQLNTALTGGTCTVIANYGFSTFVGG